MRFTLEGEDSHNFVKTEPSLTIANRVKGIADEVERQLVEDDVSHVLLWLGCTCCHSHCIVCGGYSSTLMSH